MKLIEKKEVGKCDDVECGKDCCKEPEAEFKMYTELMGKIASVIESGGYPMHVVFSVFEMLKSDYAINSYLSAMYKKSAESKEKIVTNLGIETQKQYSKKH